MSVFKKLSKEEVLTLAKNTFKHHKNFQIVDTGYENIVVFIDFKYVLRYPRTEKAFLKSIFEHWVLKRLPTSNFRFPKLFYVNEDPFFFVTEYIDGIHLNPSDIRKLSEEKQINFAKDYAKAVSEIHKSFNYLEVKEKYLSLNLDKITIPWEDYFKEVLIDYTLPNEAHNKLAKEIYEKWQKIDKTKNQVLVHDDLHTSNIIFKRDDLIGILDFGEASFGISEQELRQLFRINELCLKEGVKEYNRLTNRNVNPNDSKTWAIIQELASFANHIKNNNLDSFAYKRSVNHLKHWYPDIFWDQDDIKIDKSRFPEKTNPYEKAKEAFKEYLS